MKTISQKSSGAAALIAAIMIGVGLLSIVLSVMFVSLNMRENLLSFTDSMQSFYTAESGIGEALIQLRRQHNNYNFRDLTVGGLTASSQFIDMPGECEPIPECQFAPDSGWWAEYFNYSVNHPDMEVDPPPGSTPNPLDHDWYRDIYKTHEEIDANLEFPLSMWFPYDGTIYADYEGYAHDYHFGVHWRAKVTAAVDSDYSYHLGSNDDSWVLVDDSVVVNHSGTHEATLTSGTIFLSAGDNVVDIYFAERHTDESGFSFYFDEPSLIITPWPEGCGEENECNSNIETLSGTDRATRKARYTCDQNIANCFWKELVP